MDIVLNSIFNIKINSVITYYLIRYFQGFLFALGETLVLISLKWAQKNYFKDSKQYYLLFLSFMFSTGYYVAIPSFLANSWSLLFHFFGLAAFLGRNIFYFSLACTMSFWFGWAYGVLSLLPCGIYLFFESFFFPKFLFKRMLKFLSVFLSFFLLTGGFVALVDYQFYQKLVFPNFKSLFYNLKDAPVATFYGSEPWYFYIFNGLLQFNISLLFSFLAIPIWLLYRYVHEIRFFTRLQSFEKSYIVISLSVLFYFVIFSSQSHKEERFLFPIFSFISFSAIASIYYFSYIVSKISFIPSFIKVN